MNDEPQRQGWAPRDTSAPTPPGPADRPADRTGGKKADKRAGRQARKRARKEAELRRRTGPRGLLPTWRMTLGALLFCALLVIGGFALGYKLVDIPAANATATAQSNVYLYADGTEIARDGEINRENVQLAQVPRTVQRTVLAAEDRGFYNEPAVDPQGMIRAAWNTATGKGTQGGSTITQQYVKNYYLGQEQTIARKAKEFFIAIKLNREQTKEQILQGYLNTSFFGRNAYGIQAAAQAYYGKDVEGLTTAEGAYLASLLNAPSEFDVVLHPENKPAAEARWNYVLDGMVKEKWLDARTRATLKFPTPGPIRSAATGLSGQRGYLVQAVGDYLTGHHIIAANTLATGGYRITTTLERKKQNALVKAVDNQVTSQLDSSRAADRNVRVGGVSIAPGTGHVVAMYGGIDYTKQYVNNATRRDYQVGSTFKPFVFAAAVQNGSETQDGRPITPNTVYDGDTGRMVEGPGGPTGYAPDNEDDVDYGPITVRTATDKSVNAVYAQLAEDVGPATVRNTAVALGIPADTPDLTASPSIALGPATASVLDLTQAYATLAHHGERTPYTLVAKVTKNGTDITLPARATTRAVSREAADTTTAMLRGVVDGGTGTAAQSAGRPAAGKTGTAEEDRAAWFAGYTPNLATVVAVLGADPRTARQEPLYGALGLARINGGGAPAQIWGEYTANALRSTPVQDFDLQVEAGSTETASPDQQESPEPSTPGSASPRPSTQGQSQGQNQGQTQGQSQGRTGGATTTGSTGGGQSPPPGQGRTPGGTDGSGGGTTTTGGGATTGGTADEGPFTGGAGDSAGGDGTGGTGDTGATDGTPTTGGTAGQGPPPTPQQDPNNL
ncbi:transglycosylase domain-containing protein [Streptomyces sp. JV176]|uniref:transglycosylase domain-containing protein n=1 Tax=Streptomyces sp. JV176 TaxID=858630 RepID=UPI002E77B734|nr:transglycosylase domain-containing protein [Streptomyces sp. JV176]MEE1802385.1 transglycosylase domain-containing protein [Streptomyces sp. JV176]